MGELVVDDEAAYAEFLQIQWHARVGVENWLQERQVEAMPPHQTDLIARDLAALRCALPDNPAGQPGCLRPVSRCRSHGYGLGAGRFFAR